jgi:hypothetical protein
VSLTRGGALWTKNGRFRVNSGSTQRPEIAASPKPAEIAETAAKQGKRRTPADSRRHRGRLKIVVSAVRFCPSPSHTKRYRLPERGPSRKGSGQGGLRRPGYRAPVPWAGSPLIVAAGDQRRHGWPGAPSAAPPDGGTSPRPIRSLNAAGAPRSPGAFAASFAAPYLQPGSLTVCPGGWHLAPPSFGPLLLLPGPKSGSATAGAAGMDRAPVARMAARSLRLRMFLLRWDPSRPQSAIGHPCRSRHRAPILSGDRSASTVARRDLPQMGESHYPALHTAIG